MRDKSFSIAKNSKYDGYQLGFVSMVYNVFGKKTSGEATKNEMSNKELTEELHKPVIRKFERRKVHSSFIDNIWVADLADVQMISKFDKGFRMVFDIMCY